MTTHDAARMVGELTERINSYLGNGGLFNPESMEHNKVRDLLLDCRSALAQLAAAEAECEAWRAMDVEHPSDKPDCKCWWCDRLGKARAARDAAKGGGK